MEKQSYYKEDAKRIGANLGKVAINAVMLGGVAVASNALRIFTMAKLKESHESLSLCYRIAKDDIKDYFADDEK